MIDRNVRLSPATSEDMLELAALAAKIWREHYPGIITHAQIDYMLARGYNLDVLRHEMEAEGIHYDLCIAGDKTAGFISYGPGPQPGELKVHKLYLLGAYHGLGLGRLMLQHAVAYAAGSGYDSVVLNVNRNNSKAIAMYERNGFMVRESVVVDIGNGFVMDDYVMECIVRR